MRSLSSLVLLLLAAVATALSTAGNRLLVVLDDLVEKDTYSKFFGDLKGEIMAGIQDHWMTTVR